MCGTGKTRRARTSQSGSERQRDSERASKRQSGKEHQGGVCHVGFLVALLQSQSVQVPGVFHLFPHRLMPTQNSHSLLVLPSTHQYSPSFSLLNLILNSAV